MRVPAESGGLTVHAVAGTYVVLLGFDLAEDRCEGLLGFSIHRVDHTEDEASYLTGMKCFEATDPGFLPGSHFTTRDHPIQSFQWADYSAKPGHEYTFTVAALAGTPENLTVVASVTVDLVTESPASGGQDVYFNRGVAASQEYARRFGNREPEDVPNHAAFDWLSRGLYEAMTEFVRSTIPGVHALRIAAYEFHHAPFLELLQERVDADVDVRIVYDHRKEQPGTKNAAAADAAGLAPVCTQRTAGSSYISHNKFIVKLENGSPTSVWTGGTNFSPGGIFGHSNVAHVVEAPAIAAKYLAYWELLAADPTTAALRDDVEALTPTPTPDSSPAVGTTVYFSPRNNLALLEWYASLGRRATDGLFMTFAFGMNDLFKDVYRTSSAPLRFALLEKKTRAMKPGPERDAEEQAIQVLRNMPENIFAIGSFVRTNAIDGWVKEKLTSLNSNVRYVHNKFMLIDPLSADPIVIAGSANFSAASTQENDENMVVTRGNTRVADVYLGEFVRLYSHHAFRESLQWRKPDEQPKYLRTDHWWRPYFSDPTQSARRRYFART